LKEKEEHLQRSLDFINIAKDTLLECWLIEEEIIKKED
jgi:hypothetical protein